LTLLVTKVVPAALVSLGNTSNLVNEPVTEGRCVSACSGASPFTTRTLAPGSVLLASEVSDPSTSEDIVVTARLSPAETLCVSEPNLVVGKEVIEDMEPIVLASASFGHPVLVSYSGSVNETIRLICLLQVWVAWERRVGPRFSLDENDFWNQAIT
jgi:hypothetical protein